MAAVSQSLAACSGLINHPGYAKLPFGHNGTKITNHNAVSVTCRRTRRAGIRCLAVHRVGTTYAASVGKDYHQLSVDDGVPQEPFLLSLFKETVWSLRSLFVFLLEQPSQLKYIEWPGFRSTSCSIYRCYSCPVGYEGAAGQNLSEASKLKLMHIHVESDSLEMFSWLQRARDSVMVLQFKPADTVV